MQLNDEQYEPIAQWLDAAEADRSALSDAQRAVAEEVVGDEAHLAGALHVQAPPASLARARARMMAELARPWWRTRWAIRAAAAAAVVAIIVFAALLAPRTPPAVEEPVSPAVVSAEFVGETMAEAAEADLTALLTDELVSIEAATFAAIEDMTLELRIDALEDDLLEDILIDDPTIWPLDDDGLSS